MDKPFLDPDDAEEARLRLGVLASALLEEGHLLCTDVHAMQEDAASRRLVQMVEDAAVLTRAMAVLARLGVSPRE